MLSGAFPTISNQSLPTTKGRGIRLTLSSRQIVTNKYTTTVLLFYRSTPFAFSESGWSKLGSQRQILAPFHFAAVTVQSSATIYTPLQHIG